jgi:hypothetical protein
LVFDFIYRLLLLPQAVFDAASSYLCGVNTAATAFQYIEHGYLLVRLNDDQGPKCDWSQQFKHLHLLLIVPACFCRLVQPVLDNKKA